MNEHLVVAISDGHYIHLVRWERVEEGTVAFDRYRVAMDARIPISAAAREAESSGEES